jgi:hypothetical protein
LQNLTACGKVATPELLDGIGEGKTIGLGHQCVIEVVLLFQDHELLHFACIDATVSLDHASNDKQQGHEALMV